MIISAHLGDFILISADKRAMIFDLETGAMCVSNNDESKIELWCRGAIAGTGDTVLINRIMNYFKSLNPTDLNLYQLSIIHKEVERRLIEGIPKEVLINTTIIFQYIMAVKLLYILYQLSSFLRKLI